MQLFFCRIVLHAGEGPGGSREADGARGARGAVEILRRLPAETVGVRRHGGRIETIAVAIKDAQGDLLGSAIPKVSIVKDGNYRLYAV